jgi:hypothetical protein
MLPWGGCMWSKHYNVEFGYQLSICSGLEENRGKPSLIGRSLDLPDTNWLLASSPALNTRTLTSVLICLLLYLGKTSHTNEDRLNNRRTDEGTITGTKIAKLWRGLHKFVFDSQYIITSRLKFNSIVVSIHTTCCSITPQFLPPPIPMVFMCSVWFSQ